MSDLERVCPADDLEPGDRTLVTVGGDPVGVFNVDGEYYAISNVCAHEGGPVCRGMVQPALAAEFPGSDEPVREFYSDDIAIACPWHGWEYSLATGHHLGDAEVSIPTYDVVLRDGVLYLEV